MIRAMTRCVAATFLLLAVAAGLAGCASFQPTFSTPAPVPAGPALNGRGNVEVALGDVITFGSDVMSITSASFDPACTESSARPAENGHYLVLEVTATTAAAGQTPDVGYGGPLNRFGFTWIDDNGMTTPSLGIGGPAGYCFPFSEYFPSPLGPAQSGAGKIVLDVTSAGGTLVYQPADQGHGYEWAMLPG